MMNRLTSVQSFDVCVGLQVSLGLSLIRTVIRLQLEQALYLGKGEFKGEGRKRSMLKELKELKVLIGTRRNFSVT